MSFFLSVLCCDLCVVLFVLLCCCCRGGVVLCHVVEYRSVSLCCNVFSFACILSCICNVVFFLVLVALYCVVSCCRLATLHYTA